MSEQVQSISMPYDSAFKSIIKKCPRLCLMLINELFYHAGLSDEEYDGTEKVILLDKELPSLVTRNYEEDVRVQVIGKTTRIYHLECQTTPDGTIILRMFVYDTLAAIDEAKISDSKIVVEIDNSGVLFLRNPGNVRDTLTVEIRAPQGKKLTYEIPVLKIQNYSLDTLLEKKLFVLLPFIFFNYERQLRKTPEDPVIYNRIRELFNTIFQKLQGSITDNNLTAYEASTLLDALKVVFRELGNTNKAGKEVEEIMHGKVLEFSADKYYNEGEEKGERKGIIKVLASLVKDGILTEKAAAVRAEMTEDEFRSALESAS